MRLATISELNQHQHGLALYCVECDRWSDADLVQLIADGHGYKLLSRTQFRCRDCGQVAERQVRPPVPGVSHAVLYYCAAK